METSENSDSPDNYSQLDNRTALKIIAIGLRARYYQKVISLTGRLPTKLASLVRIKLLDADKLVVPKNFTRRVVYDFERNFYRTTHYVLNTTDLAVDPWEFELYKSIALKYGWRYIKQ